MTTELGTESALGTYLVILRRRKWWVISLALLGLAVSLASSLTAHKRYTAAAQVLVQGPASPGAPGTAQPPVTQTDVETELQLVTSAPVQAQVRGKLGSAPAVSVSEVGQTNVISITATNGSPGRAAAIANAYAKAFVGYRQSVANRNLGAAGAQLRQQISSIASQVNGLHGQGSSSSANPSTANSPEASALLNQEAVLKEQLAQMQVSGTMETQGVELVTPAEAPAAPSSPKPVQNILLGLAAGLALGLGAAFLRNNLDETLSSKEAAEHAGGAPVLAMIPMVASWRTRNEALVVSATDPSSPAAESYRSLRTSLQFARQERQLRSLVVTSPGASEGKTATVANLGLVFAHVGERVVLVSCDLRRPRLEQFFGLGDRDGLTSVLVGERSLEDVLQPVDGNDRLWMLPAGPVPPNPAELLDGMRTRQVLADLHARFDLVLIDSPPVLPVTDPVVLSKHADGALLVAAADQTRRSNLRRAAERLSQVNVAVMGIVLNEVTKQTGYGYGYGYGYSYKPYLAETRRTDGRPHGNGKAHAPASAD
jgi:capsular exopolysaccharide synthesis family protein